MIVTHTYTGPTTKWGLIHGTPGRLVGKHAGGVQFRTQEGKQFIVGKQQVRRIDEARRTP